MLVVNYYPGNFPDDADKFSGIGWYVSPYAPGLWRLLRWFSYGTIRPEAGQDLFLRRPPCGRVGAISKELEWASVLPAARSSALVEMYEWKTPILKLRLSGTSNRS